MLLEASKATASNAAVVSNTTLRNDDRQERLSAGLEAIPWVSAPPVES
jgi:hypothetical protein